MSEKNDCLIELKEFMPQIFAWEEAYCVSFQKRLCKMKYGAEGSISNVDLDLFWSNTGFEIWREPADLTRAMTRRNYFTRVFPDSRGSFARLVIK